MKKILSFLFVAIFSILIVGCSSTFRTMNVRQPILLSSKIITVDGKKIPPGTINDGKVSGSVLYSQTYSYNQTTTEEKANADVDFLNCVKTDAGNFVTGLTIEAINYQYFLFAGGESEIDYWGNCHQLPSSTSSK